MIDLISTRDSTDPHTAGCARLLASVIADAIHCASRPPRKEEVEFEINRNWESCDAARSMWFLFDDDSPFFLYAKLIGLDAESVRLALLDPSKTYTPKGGFSDGEARIIRIRYQWQQYLKRNVSPDVYKRTMLEMPQREDHVPKAAQKKDDTVYIRANSVWEFAQLSGEQ